DDDDDDDDDDGRRHAGSAIALADCPRHVLLLPLHRPFPCSCHLKLHVPASCRVAIEFCCCLGPCVTVGPCNLGITRRAEKEVRFARWRSHALSKPTTPGTYQNPLAGFHARSPLCAAAYSIGFQITRELRSTLLSYLLAEYGVGLIQNGLPILHLPEHEAQEADEEEEEDDDGFLEVILLYVDAVDDSEVPTVKYGYRKKMVMIDGSCSLALWIERDMADGG
ncbi:hypothetical protein B296_00002826, partial [Ensete ventricosum]